MKETLDCRGMRCPLPIIACARKIKEITDGETFILLADDPATQTDLQAWARMTGHQCTLESTGRWLIEKKVTG